MKYHKPTKKDLTVLFVACLPVGFGFIFFGCWIIWMSNALGILSPMRIFGAFIPVLFGLGILQFVYLMASNKHKTHKISNWVLYLVSIGLMAIASFCLLAINRWRDGPIRTVYNARALYGIFILGLCGLMLARQRSKENKKKQIQGMEPTR